jgi:hypothetical protein
MWNVTYPRNPQFTGRSEIIARLAAELSSGAAAAVTQAISGLGGIGKTQLALEYCYRHRDSYKLIWWIRAESKETRLIDLMAIGHLGHLVAGMLGARLRITQTNFVPAVP